jgi:hypothetical protein
MALGKGVAALGGLYIERRDAYVAADLSTDELVLSR